MESFCWIRGKVFSIGNFLVSQTGERGLFWKFEGELFWSICWHRKPIGLGTIWCICLSTFPTVFNLCSTISNSRSLLSRLEIDKHTYISRSKSMRPHFTLRPVYRREPLFFFLISIFTFNFRALMKKTDEGKWWKKSGCVCRVIWKSRSRHSDDNYDSPFFCCYI